MVRRPRSTEVASSAAAALALLATCSTNRGAPATAEADAGVPVVVPAGTSNLDGGADGSQAWSAPPPPADAGSAKSCNGGHGADTRCGGVSGNESAPGTDDCCASLAVPGGSFLQFDDPAYPTTVSAFRLDAFEVTAGRFRAWVEATDGNLRGSAPAVGMGAHPKIPGSGWRAEWSSVLPTSRADVDSMLGPEQCQVGANLDDFGALTWWTPALQAKLSASAADRPDILAASSREALDEKPLVCVPWQVLFAFCVWDGGRLPTNAEFGFAAAGGAEQRDFPWGNLPDDQVARIGEHENLSVVPLFTPGASFVVAALWDPASGANVFPESYAFTWGGRYASPHDNALHIAPVGRRVAGRGKWGHSDLAGNVYEWMLDEGPIRPGPCVDCANVSWPSLSERDPSIPMPFPLQDFEDRWFVGGARAIRGGAWDNALGLANRQTKDEIATYTSYPLLRTYRSLGGRCARDMK